MLPSIHFTLIWRSDNIIIIITLKIFLVSSLIISYIHTKYFDHTYPIIFSETPSRFSLQSLSILNFMSSFKKIMDLVQLVLPTYSRVWVTYQKEALLLTCPHKSPKLTLPPPVSNNCHIQRTLFCSSLPQLLAVTILLFSLLQWSPSLDWRECDNDAPSVERL